MANAGRWFVSSCRRRRWTAEIHAELSEIEKKLDAYHIPEIVSSSNLDKEDKFATLNGHPMSYSDIPPGEEAQEPFEEIEDKTGE